ncbi:hypothetical protein PanWU01x14_242550 [Parasponia andersonii]|uniref:Uncharacterized protein n=1 Tax=Parasponia andersonii TaxID=3476 RepID=A0A2P5BFQ7_PARAD|nr:hypothetical protein PanWU01x14_242550 [Parasponia andersonii]
MSRHRSTLHRGTSEAEAEVSATTEEGEIINSPKRAARIAFLKYRFAEIIRKAKKQLEDACKETAPDAVGLRQEKLMSKNLQRSRNHGNHGQLMIKKRRTRDEADYDDRDLNKKLQRSTNHDDHGQLIMIKKQRRGLGEVDHHDRDLINKKLKISRNHDHGQLMMIKKQRHTPDEVRSDLMKNKKGQCGREFETRSETDDDRELIKKKRKQEIERLREAARIEINKITKIVDFDDNLSVTKEFEKLTGASVA